MIKFQKTKINHLLSCSTVQPGQVENQWFRFFISTPRLLKMSAKAETLHADGTYKLIIQGYPVIIVGSSDMARKFHMIGMAVCMSETADDYEFIFNAVIHGVSRITGEEIRPKRLVTDAAHAIQNGFNRAFAGEDCQIIMCWFHVMFNIKNRRLQNEQDREVILNDIRKLQLSYS